MYLRRSLSGLAVLAAVLAGCGDDDPGSLSSSDPVGQPTDSSVDTGDGDESSSVGAPVDLGDFPIPVPPDTEVSPPIDSDGVTAVSFSFAADRFDSVVAFYDDFTASGPDEYQRTEAGAGGVVYNLVSGAPGELRSIVVSAPTPGDDTTFASLTSGTAG